MRLESAQGLKQELLESVIVPFTVGARAISSVPAVQRSVALGVADVRLVGRIDKRPARKRAGEGSAVKVNLLQPLPEASALRRSSPTARATRPARGSARRPGAYG